MTARSWQPPARSRSRIRTNRSAVRARLAGARVAVTISLLFPLLAPCPGAGRRRPGGPAIVQHSRSYPAVFCSRALIP